MKLLVQIGTQIFLARLLGPEQYGIFAIGAIVISFSNFFSDVGIAYGLIQRPQVTDEHIRFVFTWQLVLGITVSAVVAALAGPLSVLLKEPRAHDVLLALAPICFIQAAAAVSLNLLKRKLDFKALQFAQTAGYVIGFLGVGVPMAVGGLQVWALVGAWGVQTVVTFALLYWQVNHAAKPMFRHRDEKEMASFGLRVLATNVTNWAIGNIERVVIARNLPAAAVGLYAIPYNLMYTPSTTVSGVVQPVMYAACARVQGEQVRIGKAYLTLVAAISLGAIPLFAAIAVVAPTFVLALYGPAWAEAAVVLRPIALAMPFFLLWTITTPVLWTNDQPGLEFKLQLPLATLWLAAALIAVQHSLSAVAWTVCALYFVRFALFVVAAGRLIGVGAGTYFDAARGGIVLGATIAGTASLIDAVAPSIGVTTAGGQLVVVVLGCLAMAIGILKAAPSVVEPTLMTLVREVHAKLPPSLAAPVSWLLPKVPSK